jgi:hypothetical protein
MSGVSQNIDPTPSPARRVCSSECIPSHLVRGEDTLTGWRAGWGVNILEDARHCSVLYFCKYFVGKYVDRMCGLPYWLTYFTHINWKTESLLLEN